MLSPVAAGAPARAASLLLPWPVLALAVWLAAAALQAAGHAMGLIGAGTALALVLGVVVAGLATGWSWQRRALVALGWPLALLLTQASVPGWAWALALGIALLAYPLRAWRDAPLFPTPATALQGLAAALPLPAGARVLDAGCGTGDGLRALAAEFPGAALEGVEHSALWCALARWRCRGIARVRRGDLWRDDWSGPDLIYLFQRPETMPRAWDKACREGKAGAWLASLQFAIPGRAPDAVLREGERWPLYLYRLQGAAAAAASGNTGRSPEKPAPRSIRRPRRR